MTWVWLGCFLRPFLADDDSSSTSSLVLQLLTKAAAVDLNSKALHADLDHALRVLATSLAPEHARDAFFKYATHKNKRVADKAAACALGLPAP